MRQAISIQVIIAYSSLARPSKAVEIKAKLKLENRSFSSISRTQLIRDQKHVVSYLATRK